MGNLWVTNKTISKPITKIASLLYAKHPSPISFPVDDI